mgnify:CR=1 FL=1
MVDFIKNIVKLRPHHLLCIEGFKGLGYSKDFVDNMKNVISDLLKSGKVSIIKGVDDICRKCPYLDGNACNNTYGRSVNDMDEIVVNKLGLIENTIEDYYKIKEKIYNVFRKKDDLYGICDKCSWKDVCDFYKKF